MTDRRRSYRSFRQVIVTVPRTHKVGTKGEVVLPKRLRGELGIEPGDDVLFEQDGPAICVRKATAPGELWGSLADSRIDPLAELDARRQRDLARLGRVGEERERPGP
jgi:AbrB family looped-hinge helix DNA binding protein